jgi:hypothetical protein
MNSIGSRTPLDSREYWSWIGFWGQFAVLALLAIVGAFFASEGGEPGDYSCGLWLSVTAIALAFLRLKQYFDTGRTDWPSFLFVDDMTNLIAVIVVFVIVGLIGLFVAAGSDSNSLQASGVALFIASGLAVFLSLKHVFDKLDARH